MGDLLLEKMMTIDDQVLGSMIELVNRIHAGEEKSVTLEAASKAVADYICGQRSQEALADEDLDDVDDVDEQLANELQGSWMDDSEDTLKLMAQILSGIAGHCGLKDLSMVAHGIWLDA